MGKWRLFCPTGGEYTGDCTYKKKGRKITLTCKRGLKEITPCNPGTYKARLERCIRKLKKQPGINPYAVCRARVKK